MQNTQPQFSQNNNPSLQFNGNCGFNIDNNRVEINIDSISNQRFSDDVSGTISIELWATKQPYQGGEFDGVVLAGTTIGEIMGQHFVPDCRYDLLFNEPPAGTWNLVLMLREWNGNSYETRDFVNFATPYTANWVPTVVQGKPAKVINVSFNETEKSNKADPKVDAPKKPAQPEAKAAPAKEEAKPVAAKPAKVEAKKPEVTAAPAKAAAKPASTPAGTINLNTADESDIAKISGVSARLAARMVEARPFKSMDDVLKVKGMGAKLMAKIQKLISL